MNRIFLLFFLTVSYLLLSSAQPAPLSVQLLVKKSSGFLGMGSPRSLEVELSNQLKQQPLTSDNVNGGNYYYFLCKPKNWTFDEDFVTEELQKLFIVQDVQKFQIVWKETFHEDNPAPALLVGFSKSLQLHKPFSIEFDYGEGIDSKQFIVPMELWPGYTQIMKLWNDANELQKAQRLKEAVKVYDQLLSNNQYQIFPFYENARSKRTQIFRDIFERTKSAFAITMAQEFLNPKEKMLQIVDYLPQFQYVVDSLPNAAANVTIADTSVNALLSETQLAIVRATSARDSLLRAADEVNLQWLLNGNVSENKRVTYLSFVPFMVYALSSIDFTATTIPELSIASLSDQQQAELRKLKLTEMFESFLRIMNKRLKEQVGLFSQEFFFTLRLDTAYFSQPFYSMLKSINNFFLGDITGAKNELVKVFRHCDDNELLSRFHILRIALDLYALDVSRETIRLLREADAAEKNNDLAGALERYKQVMIIAPNYAYASFALGSYYLRTNETERALAFFKKAYQIDKTYFPAYRETYNVYNRTGNFKPMIEVLTLAIQNGNDYWETNFNLGYAYQGEQDFTRAAQYFERALALNPKSYRTMVNCGIAYQNSRKYNKAREFFNRAIELDPDRPEAVSMLKQLDEIERGVR